MVFLFITSQLMNIKTAFYFMGFLYLPAKKNSKSRGIAWPLPHKNDFFARNGFALTKNSPLK